MHDVRAVIATLKRRFARREGGAAVVEYALFVGLLVLGVTAAIGGLEDDAEDYYVGVSDDIGDLPQLAIPNLTLPDGTPITTTTNAPVTTTTTASTSSTTTTTAPPGSSTTSTTSTTTTTTTGPPRTYVSQLLNRSEQVKDDEWDVTVRVTLKNSANGNYIVGAEVKLLYTWFNEKGDFKDKDKKCKTGSNGYCSVTEDFKDDDFRPWDQNVTVTVIEIKDENPVWDNAAASIVVPLSF